VDVGAQGTSSAALVREQQVLGRMARRFHLRDEDLRERLKTLRRGSTRLTHTQPEQEGEAAAENAIAMLSRFEREIFELVLSDGAFVVPIFNTIPLEAMESRPARWLFEQCHRLHIAHQPVNFERLMALASSERQQKLLIDLDESAGE